MATLVHPTHRDCVTSLGIPVDKLTLEETIDAVLRMARTRDGRSRLVSTLNVDFLVNSLGTGLSRARHPELLSVLRNSDLVTADGFPIIWLSRIMGKPLPERVCGSDLVPALAERGAKTGLSLFLLGGGNGVAAEAAETLTSRYPGIRIAGTAAPFVHTEGAGLVNFAEDDAQIVEQINRSGADILLVGLGNPKQELWFNRNREQLTVPVSIGVGGTFEFITGGVRRAPQWWQQHNLEWVYRIVQDPVRLWQRYTKGLAKLAALTLPLLTTRLHQSLVLLGKTLPTGDNIQWNTVWSSRQDSMAILKLPRLVSAQYLQNMIHMLTSTSGDSTMRLLDFSDVRHIELAGYQSFFGIAELLEHPDYNIQALGISSRLRRSLAAARVLDILEISAGDALQKMDLSLARHEFGCRSYVMNETALIFLSGKVNASNLRGLGFTECLQHTSRDRACIIDLRNVSLLESSAIAELSSFMDPARGHAISFSGVSASTQQMLKMADLGLPASILGDCELLEIISVEKQKNG